MGGLETAVLVLGFAGWAAFTSVAIYFEKRRVARRAHVEVPLPELAARLQPADVPLKVRVLGDTGPGRYGTTIVIDGVADRLTLRRQQEPPPPPVRRGVVDYEPTPPPPAPELEIGDPDFDGAFFVLGPPTLVYALLDAETRRLLRLLTADAAYRQPGDISVERGRLQVHVPLSQGLQPDPVEERGHQAVALARRLLKPHDLARRLSDNAQNDPFPAVRLRNLNASIREEPANPMTRAMLRAAASDRDPEIRLRAALALGPEGRDVLIALATSDSADDVTVETSIQALGADVPFELAARVLRRALGDRLRDEPAQPRAARACLAALAAVRGMAAIAELKAVLLANASLATHAARALGDVGGDAAEAALVDALAADEPQSRLAAAKVLGAIGGAAAVVPLREAERRGGELRRVARQAIAEVQSRLTGAPGEVSLTAGETGQVSVVEDARGRVSVPQPGPGRREG